MTDDEYTPPEILAAFRPGADASAPGPRSQTVRGTICGSCAGWPDPPTSEEVVRPHLGGGTILAARLRHRLSTDIDVFLPGRYSLIGLAQEDEASIIRRLGGTAESVSGSIVRPVPSEGQQEAWIAGRREMVLTNAQILRGKLDRPERVLVRDVVDVLVAAEADPSALATAASLLAPERAAPPPTARSAARNLPPGLPGSDRQRPEQREPQDDPEAHEPEDQGRPILALLRPVPVGASCQLELANRVQHPRPSGRRLVDAADSPTRRRRNSSSVAASSPRSTERPRARRNSAKCAKSCTFLHRQLGRF